MLDATNSTEERRHYLRSRFHGKWQYLFIESICNDMEARGRWALAAGLGAGCWRWLLGGWGHRVLGPGRASRRARQRLRG